jgi:hypothetical protein
MPIRSRNISDFEPLTEAESRLLTHVQEGTVAILGHTVPPEDIGTSPNVTSYSVRAEFVGFLVRGDDENIKTHEQGIKLQGAWIKGKLDLLNVQAKYPLLLAVCRFEEALVLQDAFLKTVALYNSIVPGIHGNRVTINGDFLLSKGFICTDVIRLKGAKIEGCIDLSGATLKSADDRFSLSGDRSKIGGGIFLREGFTSHGSVQLLGAQIDGDLDCTDAIFHGGQNQTEALAIDGSRIIGSVFLTQSTCQGRIRLAAARISESLSLGGATLCGANGGKEEALIFDRARIEGGVFLNNDFSCRGEIRFPEAHIDGSIFCNGAKLFGNESGSALRGDGSCTAGDVVLNDGFLCEGEINFSGAKIGKSLIVNKGKIATPTDNHGNPNSLICRSTVINDSLNIGQVKISGFVDLSSATTQTLCDGDLSSWPSGKICLDGFVYRHLGENSLLSGSSRISWLKSQVPSCLDGNLKAQPWINLVQTLSRMGHVVEARKIGIAYEKSRSAAGQLGAAFNPIRWIHFLYGKISGYGYQPLRIAYWLIGMWLLFGVLFAFAAKHGHFAPTNPLIFDNPKYSSCAPTPDSSNANWYWCDKLPGEFTTFSPFAYSLDLILPIVDLQQERDWAPIIETPQQAIFSEVLHVSWGHIVRLLMWIEILFGWFATSVLVVIMAGLVKVEGTK